MIISKKTWRRIDAFFIKSLRNIRIRRLNNTDFTIICNNCWGGYVYRRYNLPYNTPTVGLYFFPKDYIRFINNLRYYLESEINFIKYEESQYCTELEKNNQTKVPIGKIDDIEIIFLHYTSEEEARAKWQRRVKRVNYDNLIFKFSEMNSCTEKDLINFDSLKARKKICFVTVDCKVPISCGIVYKSATGEQITDDTSEYGRYINLDDMINSKEVNGIDMK